MRLQNQRHVYQPAYYSNCLQALLNISYCKWQQVAEQPHAVQMQPLVAL